MSKTIPARSTFRTMRKFNKGKIPGIATRGFSLNMGDFGLKILEPAKITPEQIETMRRVIMRETKKIGKLFILIFPNRAVSKKAQEVRMGGGKGAFDHWVYVAKPGVILFELSGVSEELAKKAFTAASYKFGPKVKIVGRQVWE